MSQAVTEGFCVVYRETDFAMHLHRGGSIVGLIRKIDPVPRQTRTKSFRGDSATIPRRICECAKTKHSDGNLAFRVT